MSTTDKPGRGKVTVVPAAADAFSVLKRYLTPQRAIALAGTEWLKSIPPDVDALSGRALSEWDRTSLVRHLERCPPRPVLLGLLRDLEPFLEEGVVPNVTELAVAILFDSRARQPDNGPAYVSTLTHDLIDLKFPSAAVVAACQELRRTSIFMPEIAEVISTCERHAKTYASQVRLAHRVLERQADIELLLVEDRHRQAVEAAVLREQAADDSW